MTDGEQHSTWVAIFEKICTLLVYLMEGIINCQWSHMFRKKEHKYIQVKMFRKGNDVSKFSPQVFPLATIYHVWHLKFGTFGCSLPPCHCSIAERNLRIWKLWKIYLVYYLISFVSPLNVIILKLLKQLGQKLKVRKIVKKIDETQICCLKKSKRFQTNK